MKKFRGYVILSGKEMLDIEMAMIDSEAMMDTIKDNLHCGVLEHSPVKTIDGTIHRTPNDYLIDMLEKSIKRSENVRKLL